MKTLIADADAKFARLKWEAAEYVCRMHAEGEMTWTPRRQTGHYLLKIGMLGNPKNKSLRRSLTYKLASV